MLMCCRLLLTVAIKLLLSIYQWTRRIMQELHLQQQPCLILHSRNADNISEYSIAGLTS